MGEYSLIFTWQTAVVYLIVINVSGFLIMGFDKWKAKRGSWRIPEKTLFTITLMGGGVGTIAGMYTFRHKTQKAKFVFGFPAIIVIQIVIALMIIFKI